MKVVYISHPYQNSSKDNQIVKDYCKKIMKKGYLPIIPCLYFSQLIDSENSEDWKETSEMKKSF